MAGDRRPQADARNDLSTSSPPVPGKNGRVLVAYGLGQAVLAVIAYLVPYPASGAVCLAMVALGIMTLGAGVIRRRPARAPGWWLLAAGTAALLAAHAVTAAIDGLTASATVVTPPAVPFALLSIPLLGAGLTVLSCRPAPGGVLDALDASMVAAATLLLGWLVVTNSLTPSPPGLPVVAFLLPFGVVAVFGTAVKLLMSTGLSNASLVLVDVAVAALLASTLLVMLPAVHSGTVVGTRSSKVLWAVSGALLGAAALHRSFGRPIRRRRTAPTDLPMWRIVVFAVIAVLVPLGLAVDLLNRSTTFDHTAAGVAGPTAAAAMLLLVLLARLAVTARISDRRAEILRQRTGALTLAMDQQESLRCQLTYRATHDPLTGLANRVVLDEHLHKALVPATDGDHALLLLDLDGFKEVNDTYGHPTGDDLLTAVAGRLRAVTPPGGLIARLGGDEFAMLIGVTEPDDATARGQAILDTLRPPFPIGGHELFISASIGLLLTGPAVGSMTPSDALRDADLSLYAAKGAGKNRIVTFTPQLRDERMEAASIGSGLRHALSHNHIFPHYQPIIDLTTGTTVAVEALARWTPPGGRPIPPDQFIPVAEATGLIDAVGEHILRSACAAASRWYAAYGVAVAVNVSGHQLTDPGFADTVLRALADHRMPGDGLILELTESSLIDTRPDGGELVHLRALRARGIRIAIDDFGTGFSSLSYLANLPVDIVKLDQAFAHPGDDPAEANWTYTGALLQLIASLGLTAITEGVETPEQDRGLRRLGCRYAQGYLYAPPQPTAGIDRILSDGSRHPPR